jgi:outer membrane protein OmpA-like peptidoglycan-associated protein
LHAATRVRTMLDMRRPVLVVLAWLLSTVAAAEPKLSLQIGDGDIDLVGRRIHFVLGAVAKSAELKLYSPEGALLHQGVETYDVHEPGTRLSVGWPDLGKQGENFRIELVFTDTGGNWVGFEVVRFYIEIPHEEVVFASGKWDVTTKEEAKLVEPLRLLKEAASKYAKEMNVQLYVAGHTDTVGKASDNQALSEKRAHSIAAYFAEHGLSGMPILVRGFGEGAPAVKTADNVAEAKNRRAQYIVSSFTPQVAGPGDWRPYR